MGDAHQHIAIVRKNAVEEVRVALTEFCGKDLVDVRIFQEFAGANGERTPTRKGLALHVSKLPALIAALEAAREAAERRGLLSNFGASQ